MNKAIIISTYNLSNQNKAINNKHDPFFKVGRISTNQLTNRTIQAQTNETG